MRARIAWVALVLAAGAVATCILWPDPPPDCPGPFEPEGAEPDALEVLPAHVATAPGVTFLLEARLRHGGYLLPEAFASVDSLDGTLALEQAPWRISWRVEPDDGRVSAVPRDSAGRHALVTVAPPSPFARAAPPPADSPIRVIAEWNGLRAEAQLEVRSDSSDRTVRIEVPHADGAVPSILLLDVFASTPPESATGGPAPAGDGPVNDSLIAFAGRLDLPVSPETGFQGRLVSFSESLEADRRVEDVPAGTVLELPSRKPLEIPAFVWVAALDSFGSPAADIDERAKWIEWELRVANDLLARNRTGLRLQRWGPVRKLGVGDYSDVFSRGDPCLVVSELWKKDLIPADTFGLGVLHLLYLPGFESIGTACDSLAVVKLYSPFVTTLAHEVAHLFALHHAEATGNPVLTDDLGSAESNIMEAGEVSLDGRNRTWITIGQAVRMNWQQSSAAQWVRVDPFDSSAPTLRPPESGLVCTYKVTPECPASYLDLARPGQAASP